MSSSIQQYLDFAMEAAWNAGQLTLRYFQTGVQVDRKEDDSPVTAADRGSEELLRRAIESRFPGHAILGEEQGTTEADSPHRWILDPIDGTQSFIRGVPLYAVLVGLEREGEMIVGVCHLPALGEMIAAGRGLGCRWNGREARVSKTDRLEEALVGFTDAGDLEDEHRSFWESLRQASRVQRGWSDAYGHGLLATGRVDIMLDPVMNIWDCAALLPIVEEAGGSFTDWKGGRRIDGGSALSTNGRLLGPVLELMQGGSRS